MPAEVKVLFTEEGAKEVVKATDEIAQKMGVLSDDFKKQNPIITQNVETWGQLEDKLKKGGDVSKDAAEKITTAGKASGKFSTQLKGMAKGLLGVATAYAAGRWLVSFAKEALKAAAAAGKLPPAFDEAEKSTKRLKETVGELAGQDLQDLVKWLTKLKNAYTDQVQARITLNLAEEQGLITSKEHSRLLQEASTGQIDLTEASKEYENQLEQEYNAQSVRNALLEKGRLMNELYGDTINELVQDAEELANIAPINILAEIDPSVGSDMDEVIQKAKFVEMGGQDIADVWTDEIKPAIEDGTIPIGLAAEAAVAFKLELIRVRLAAKEISLQEAIKEARELGLTYGDAKSKVQGIANKMDALDGKEIDVFVNIVRRGSMPRPTGPSGERTGEATGTGTEGGAIPSFQQGGSFIVPPGFPGDRFPMRVSSGERVTVQPAAQQAQGESFDEMAMLLDSLPGRIASEIALGLAKAGIAG